MARDSARLIAVSILLLCTGAPSPAVVVLFAVGTAGVALLWTRGWRIG